MLHHVKFFEGFPGVQHVMLIQAVFPGLFSKLPQPVYNIWANYGADTPFLGL